MTLGEFRKQTKDLGNDILVVLSADGEGNSFSPLAVAIEAIYVAETTWQGSVIGLDDKNWDDNGKEAKEAIVLYPIN